MKDVIPKLILCDLQENLTDQFRTYFDKYDHVEVADSGDWEATLPTDCIVSPANGYGLMDGGFDEVLTRFFGEGLQQEVRRHIRRDYAGEQPVGTCIIVPTGHDDVPFCAHTPAMSTPQDISGTLNVYYAFKAMLIAVTKNIHIGEVVATGLGTFYGNMDAEAGASQMERAYAHVLQAYEDPDFLRPDVSNHLLWPIAIDRAQELQDLRNFRASYRAARHGNVARR